MGRYTEKDLEEALRAITSTLRKSEKVQVKLKAGTFQHAMTERGIKAYELAIALIKRELGTISTEDSIEKQYAQKELEEALHAINLVISRVEKVQPKFEAGTSQHTLAVRRIKAFQIAAELIERKLDHLMAL